MDMNIKGMDDVLVGRAKMAAMAGGVSLKVFVIDALNEKLDREARYDRTGVGDIGTDVGESSKPKKDQRGRRKATAGVTGDAKGSEAVVGGPDHRPVERDQSNSKSDSLKSGHDTKNCRIYRCGQCSALGVKNLIRGLK